MKKVMVVMTMVVALSFLVSMIAVAPAVAKQVTKTPPTATQQTPAKAPVAPAQQMPKRLWDLEFDHLVVKGVVITKEGGYKTVDVNRGESVTFVCYYKMKTILVDDITAVDAAYWGKGFSYGIKLALCPAPCDQYSVIEKYVHSGHLPKFTYEDVKQWTKGASKEWTEQEAFLWKAIVHGAENPFVHGTSERYVENVVDDSNAIAETNEQNNGIYLSNLKLKIVIHY